MSTYNNKTITLPNISPDDFYAKFINHLDNNHGSNNFNYSFDQNYDLNCNKTYRILGLPLDNDDYPKHQNLYKHVEKIINNNRDNSIRIKSGNCDNGDCKFAYEFVIDKSNVLIKKLFGHHFTTNQVPTKPINIIFTGTEMGNFMKANNFNDSYFLNKNNFDKNLSTTLTNEFGFKIGVTSSCDFGKNTCEFTFTQPNVSDTLNNDVPIKTNEYSRGMTIGLGAGAILGGLVSLFVMKQ